MIPWFLVTFIQAICRFFGMRAYAVGTIGGWGAVAIRFQRAGPVDPKLEQLLTELADAQPVATDRPSGWARAQRRPAIG